MRKIKQMVDISLGTDINGLTDTKLLTLYHQTEPTCLPYFLQMRPSKFHLATL